MKLPSWMNRANIVITLVCIIVGYAFSVTITNIRLANAENKAEWSPEVEHLLKSGFLSTDPNAPGELCEHIGTWDSLEEAEEFFAKGYYDTKKYGRVYTDPYLYEKETGRKLTPSDRRHFGMKELIHEQEVVIVEPEPISWADVYKKVRLKRVKGYKAGCDDEHRFMCVICYHFAKTQESLDEHWKLCKVANREHWRSWNNLGNCPKSDDEPNKPEIISLEDLGIGISASGVCTLCGPACGLDDKSARRYSIPTVGEYRAEYGITRDKDGNYVELNK